jgi:hypothetical protein
MKRARIITPRPYQSSPVNLESIGQPFATNQVNTRMYNDYTLVPMSFLI